MKGQTSWLKHHLENFVRPYLGFVPTEGLEHFTPNQMSVIKNAWRSVKSHSEGRLLVLPGRDTFIFEVLARREHYPTVFLPGCSRQTVGLYQLPEDSFVMDTGFVGSIPTNLHVKTFKLLSFAIPGSNIQIFPHLSLSRGLALHVEATPKYWKTGRVLDGNVFQEYSEKEEFEKAARLTIAIYKDSSPAFVNKRQPLGSKRWEDVWML